MIGQTDQANHQYDLSDFATTLKDGNMPAVSYLKAAEYQDAHPGYSDPLDEQNFLVNTVNEIEQSKYWKSTAIVITYDDSDGWYDHLDAPRLNGSHDATTDQAVCTNTPARLGSINDRCGYGPRLPLVVISPYTRSNYVSHNVTDQASVTSFIENNWLHGQRIGSGSYDKIAGNLAGPRRCAGLQRPAELQAAHPQPHHRRGRQQALAPPTRTTRPRWPGQRAPATAATFALVPGRRWIRRAGPAGWARRAVRVHRAEGRAS